jgi:hypothetical protein
MSAPVVGVRGARGHDPRRIGYIPEVPDMTAWAIRSRRLLRWPLRRPFRCRRRPRKCRPSAPIPHAAYGQLENLLKVPGPSGPPYRLKTLAQASKDAEAQPSLAILASSLSASSRGAPGSPASGCCRTARSGSSRTDRGHRSSSVRLPRPADDKPGHGLGVLLIIFRLITRWAPAQPDRSYGGCWSCHWL